MATGVCLSDKKCLAKTAPGQKISTRLEIETRPKRPEEIEWLIKVSYLRLSWDIIEVSAHFLSTLSMVYVFREGRVGGIHETA